MHTRVHPHAHTHTPASKEGPPPPPRGAPGPCRRSPPRSPCAATSAPTSPPAPPPARSRRPGPDTHTHHKPNERETWQRRRATSMRSLACFELCRTTIPPPQYWPCYQPTRRLIAQKPTPVSVLPSLPEHA
eukprot:1012303-Rhodomonas_salina.2